MITAGLNIPASRQYHEMAHREDKRGRSKTPDGYGKRTGDCGDTVEMYIHIRNGIIDKMTYEADGCLNTHACANTVIYLAEGKHLAEAWEIAPETVIHFLETIPEEKEHCAQLAVGAFYLALADCENGKGSKGDIPDDAG